MVWATIAMFVFAAVGVVILKHYEWFSRDSQRSLLFGIGLFNWLFGKDGGRVVYLVLTVLFGTAGVVLLSCVLAGAN